MSRDDVAYTTVDAVRTEALAFQDSLMQLETWAIEYGVRAIGAILTLVIGWTLAGWASRALQRRLLKSSRVDNTLADYSGSFVRAAILCITGIAVLTKFGVETTSIVGVISAASLAIGLALQGTLSNFAAGVMLLLFRPFKEGDLVDVGGKTGSVRAIGIFAIEIKPASGEFIMIPNGQVWGSTIVNYSRNGTRRLELLISIDYAADHVHAQRRLEILANQHPRVLDTPAPTTQLYDLADSGVVLVLRAWTAAGDMASTRLELLSAIKLDFDEQGIGFPFPQRDVRILTPEAIHIQMSPAANEHPHI